jgi:putative ABC transport system permease protein
MTRDLLTQAYAAMRYNRRRTALTMLGMAWGIATVVLLLAYGAGFGRAIEVIFANWGTRIIGVFPGRTSQQAGGQKAGTQIKFTIDDIDRIVAAAPLVNHITPLVEKQSVNVQQRCSHLRLFLSRACMPTCSRFWPCIWAKADC